MKLFFKIPPCFTWPAFLFLPHTLVVAAEQINLDFYELLFILYQRGVLDGMKDLMHGAIKEQSIIVLTYFKHHI